MTDPTGKQLFLEGATREAIEGLLNTTSNLGQGTIDHTLLSEENGLQRLQLNRLNKNSMRSTYGSSLIEDLIASDSSVTIRQVDNLAPRTESHGLLAYIRGIVGKETILGSKTSALIQGDFRLEYLQNTHIIVENRDGRIGKLRGSPTRVLGHELSHAYQKIEHVETDDILVLDDSYKGLPPERFEAKNEIVTTGYTRRGLEGIKLDDGRIIPTENMLAQERGEPERVSYKTFSKFLDGTDIPDYVEAKPSIFV